MDAKSVAYPDIKTFNFSYDYHGKPLKRITAEPGLGTPNMYFLYDEKERLTQVIAPHGIIDPNNLSKSFSFELWIKYHYCPVKVGLN